MAYRSVNPFTGKLVKDYPSHTAAQVEQALLVADATFRDPSWRGNMDRRLGVLSKLAGLERNGYFPVSAVGNLPFKERVPRVARYQATA